MKVAPKLAIKSLMEFAKQKTVKIRCSLTEENVFTTGNAGLGYAMRKQVFARED